MIGAAERNGSREQLIMGTDSVLLRVKMVRSWSLRVGKLDVLLGWYLCTRCRTNMLQVNQIRHTEYCTHTCTLTGRQAGVKLLGSRMGGWLGKWGAAGSNCNGETDLSLHHRRVLSRLTRGA